VRGKTQSRVSKDETGQKRIDIVALKELVRIYKKPIDYFQNNYDFANTRNAG